MPFFVRSALKTVSKMLWDSIGHAGTTSLTDVLSCDPHPMAFYYSRPEVILVPVDQGSVNQLAPGTSKRIMAPRAPPLSRNYLCWLRMIGGGNNGEAQLGGFSVEQ
jgi:hypothetical protein